MILNSIPLAPAVTSGIKDVTRTSSNAVHLIDFEKFEPDERSPDVYTSLGATEQSGKEAFTLVRLFFEIFISILAILMLEFPRFLIENAADDVMFQHKAGWFLAWGLVVLYFLILGRAFRVMFVCHVLKMALYYLCHDYGGILVEGDQFYMFPCFAAIVGISFLRY
jgi:hypothetical protein